MSQIYKELIGLMSKKKKKKKNLIKKWVEDLTRYFSREDMQRLISTSKCTQHQ